MIAPRAVAVHRFLDSLKISRGVHNPDLAADFCTLRFIYNRYGHIGGFNKPENKICSKGNRLKWEEHRCFAFMVAFLGLLVFPRKDGNIDIRVSGIVSTLLTQSNSTLAPMIMSEIFRALTACKAGGDFFEG